MIGIHYHVVHVYLVYLFKSFPKYFHTYNEEIWSLLLYGLIFTFACSLISVLSFCPTSHDVRVVCNGITLVQLFYFWRWFSDKEVYLLISSYDILWNSFSLLSVLMKRQPLLYPPLFFLFPFSLSLPLSFSLLSIPL